MHKITNIFFTSQKNFDFYFQKICPHLIYCQYIHPHLMVKVHESIIRIDAKKSLM